MGHTGTKKSLIVHLKFKLSWLSCLFVFSFCDKSEDLNPGDTGTLLTSALLPRRKKYLLKYLLKK